MQSKARKRSQRKREHDAPLRDLRRLIDAWHDAGASDGDPLAQAMFASLCALHEAAFTGDVGALEGGPVRWARTYLHGGEQLAPRRAEVARRFIEWIDRRRVDDASGKAPFSSALADYEDREAFVLGAYGWLRIIGVRGELVPPPTVPAENVRTWMMERLSRVLDRARCDAKAIAVAMLEAWGLESGDARDALKDKDVPKVKPN